jgi:hypothetical protein
MASTLPSAKDLGVVEARPSLGIATYEGATGLEGAGARALGQAGTEIAQAGEYVQRMREEFARTQADAKHNEYQNKLLQLRQDWEKVQGADTLPETGYYDKYNRVFEEEKSRLANSLSDPLAKERFDRLSTSTELNNRAHLMEHMAKQNMAYRLNTFKDSIELKVQQVSLDPTNNLVFDTSLAGIQDDVRSFGRAIGSPEASIKLAQNAETDKLISRRIMSLANSDALAAETLYKSPAPGGGPSMRDRLSGDAARAELDKHLKTLVEPQQIALEGTTVFQKVMDTMKAKVQEEADAAQAKGGTYVPNTSALSSSSILLIRFTPKSLGKSTKQ